MDLYEYQAKSLLSGCDIPVHNGYVVTNPNEIMQFTESKVLKAQVQIGGRGKLGGVKVAKTYSDAQSIASEMFKLKIKGHEVKKILITDAANILEEYYASILFDRSKRKYLLILTKEGGVEIESLAVNNPEVIIKHYFDTSDGLTDNEAYNLCLKADFNADDSEVIAQILVKMWECYQKYDATLVEINPLAKCLEGDTQKIYALDGKVSLDDNAWFRHYDLYNGFNDELDTNNYFEELARKQNINYVKLDGNVGIIGNGAGLVMSTLDIVTQTGEQYYQNGKASKLNKAANFLDIGGGANADHMSKSLNLILSDPDVDRIFINIFGGLTQCDEVANGILKVLDRQSIEFPIVIRFAGNNASQGLQMLKNSNHKNIMVAKDINKAAQMIVEK